MKRAPLPAPVIAWHLVALLVASICLVLWIYDAAH